MKIRSSLGILTVFALLTVLFAAPTPSGAVVSGANGRIAFVSDRSGSKQIYTMRADGSAVLQLTSLGSNWDPAFSGDGTLLAFVSDRTGSPEMFTMTADGLNQKRITFNTYTESHPSWAPNNSAITYAALIGTDSDIWKVRPNGKRPIDLTPDATAFDANPAWSPGGFNIAFDRTVDGTTNVWSMKHDGTQLTQLTTSGKDSHPNWGPDNKTITFESSRDFVPPGPSTFASINSPLGVAVTGTRVLVTQFTSDKVRSLDSNGTMTTFANLPPTGNAPLERYIAISPGLGGFPAGYVYVTVGQNTYQITPDGLTVTLFVNIPTMPNGETGITFDTVGTFGYKMILTDRRGPVYTVDSSANYSLLKDVGQQIEGPVVAPNSFVPYNGQVLLGNEFADKVFAVDNAGTLSTVGTADSPEGAVQIPSTACNFGTSGGAYFVALKDQNLMQKFPATSFTGLGGDILTPSELMDGATTITRWHSDGTSVSSSSFWGPPLGDGTPDLEGSAFAPCTSGPKGPSGSGSSQTTPTTEIYRMTDTGANQTRLTNNDFNDESPAYSANGLSIVFQTDRDDPNVPACEDTGTCVYETYTMNASDGTAQSDISNNLSANDITPDWEAVSGVVTVSDFVFTPSTIKPPQGGTVLWDFTGPSEHTATDNSGMNLFDSETKDPGGYFAFRFVGAGSYPVFCEIHPDMTSTVKVPMNAAPRTGNQSTTFTITWAAAFAPKGFVFDIQILRPGAVDWVDWKTTVAYKSATFVPDTGAGTYSFKGRLRKVADSTASDYSAPISISVS